MKIQQALLGSIALLATSSAYGVTLEELAARLEQLERKVTKYESKYGPLENAPIPASAPVPQESSVPLQSPRWQGNAIRNPSITPSITPSLADELDAAYLSPPIGGRGNWFERTSIGGYGELHLNQGDVEEVDFHRFVLFFNHRFSDRIKFFSEVEVEHSLTGGDNPGEVAIEQAYIEFLLDNNWTIRAGTQVVPVGILNEVHEPDTFYGVERNNVEVNIIPTTWREAAVFATKNYENGFGFDIGVHSALAVTTDLSSNNAFRIRSGRQQVAEADASDYAATLRLRYNGIPGLALSAFVNYQNDIAPESGEDNSAVLVGGTAIYENGGFGLRGVIGSWTIQGDSFEENDADNQWGGYIEPSYRWNFGQRSVGIFARYSYYDFASGANNSRGGEFDEYQVGVNYWPISNVVLKADYSLVKEDNRSDEETFNFGLGYSF